MSLYELRMFRVIEDSTDQAELIRIQHEHPQHRYGSVALRAASRLRELRGQAAADATDRAKIADVGNRLASANIHR